MSTHLQVNDTDPLTADELTFCSSALLILSQDHEAAELQKTMLTKGSEFLRALAEAMYLAAETPEYTIDDHNELLAAQQRAEEAGEEYTPELEAMGYGPD